jgi:hypothetical protein
MTFTTKRKDMIKMSKKTNYHVKKKLLTSNPNALFSPSKPRYCRALLPLSTAVTAESHFNPFQFLSKHRSTKKSLKEEATSQKKKKKEEKIKPLQQEF